MSGTDRHGVVVGVDGSAQSLDALEWAVAFAARDQQSVSAVQAWHYPYTATVPGFELPVPPADVYSQEVAAALTKAIHSRFGGDTDVAAHPRLGSPARVLLAEAEDAALLVIGRRGGGGFHRLRIGSVSQQCAAHSTGPLVVIPQNAPELVDEPLVVVGVDGSPDGNEALLWAAEQFGSRGTVEILCAEEDSRLAEAAITNALDHVRRRIDKPDVATEQVLVTGDPRSRLLERAESAHLLVIGARGSGKLFGPHLGSVSNHLVQEAPVPVALLRS